MKLTQHLSFSCSGGSVGSITVLVRSVGGGEDWDRDIVRRPGLANHTIGALLANRFQGGEATAGADYVVVDTTLTLLVRRSAGAIACSQGIDLLVLGTGLLL